VQVHVSPEVNGLLDGAVAVSVRHNHFFVGVEHLFEALLDASALLPRAFVERYMNVLHTVSRELAREGWRGQPPSVGGEVFYTPRCAAALTDAAKYAERHGSPQAEAGHLMLALLADAHAASSRVMDRLNLGRGELIAALRAELTRVSDARAPRTETAAERASAAAAQGTGVRAAPEPPTREFPPSVKSLTRDLTQAARSGELQRAVGRDNEMFQILQVLARKNKNNVILVGEPGVGKTQIVEGLASRSHGMVTESDLAWATTQGARGLFQLSASLVRLVTKLFGKLLGSWLTVGAILILLYLSWPQFRYVAQQLCYQLFYRLLLLIG
jgi:ATP-dependent Clp protease ATP-binding subunit ClpA